MNDELLESLLAYQQMLSKSYDISIQWKGQSFDVHLTFPKDRCHHLLGLQYLTDVDKLQKDKSRVFDRLITNEAFRQSVRNSAFYEDCINRIMAVKKIEELLDSPDTQVFKYIIKKRGSRIDADFIFTWKNPSSGLPIYFYIQKGNDGNYYGKSIISADSNSRSKTFGHSHAIRKSQSKRESSLSAPVVQFFSTSDVQTQNQQQRLQPAFAGMPTIAISNLFPNPFQNLWKNLLKKFSAIMEKMKPHSKDNAVLLPPVSPEPASEVTPEKEMSVSLSTSEQKPKIASPINSSAAKEKPEFFYFSNVSESAILKLKNANISHQVKRNSSDQEIKNIVRVPMKHKEAAEKIIGSAQHSINPPKKPKR